MREFLGAKRSRFQIGTAVQNLRNPRTDRFNHSHDVASLPEDTNVAFLNGMPLSIKPGLEELELPLGFAAPARLARPRVELAQELKDFREFGQPTRVLSIRFEDHNGETREVPAYVNEFWTARQRQASSLHEVSYRACFKPQLPRFFIERLTAPEETVYDPFMGRGTTPVEAALLGRIPVGNDVNPLSVVMTRPRLKPPTLKEVEQRLSTLRLDKPGEMPEDLLAFYHPETLRTICALKGYLSERLSNGGLELVDEWIALVALNRLTGHSPGFFSVYTLPPNQAVSVRSQIKINQKRQQTPPPRDVVQLIVRKSRQLLGDVDGKTRQVLARSAQSSMLLTGPADATSAIEAGSVSLVVTSPPFLNVVQYATDNWLRCWFLGIDVASVRLTVPRKLEAWQEEMTRVFQELKRVLRPGGHVAFEVGEVHAGTTRLDEAVLPCGVAAGLEPILVLINDQKFTKTANCWGIDNMSRGTNTNRIVVFRKP